MNWILLIGFTILFSACGPGSGKNRSPADPLTTMLPVWSSISYTKDGVRTELMPPYVITQQIFADSETGICSGANIEITFSGTYNPAEVHRLEMTGLTATAEYTGSTFRFVTCMAPGAVAVTVTAYDKNNVAYRSPLTVSVNAMTATKTAGFGHPNYPNTGFAIINVAPPLASLNAGTKKMVNVYMGSVAGKSTTSTGNTGYSLETGFTNYLSQVSP